MDTNRHESEFARLETRFLTREQIMFIFDVGESTVDEWQRKKLLPCFKVGRVTRFEPAAVYDFILRFTVRGRGQNHEWTQMDTNTEGLLWARLQKLVQDQVRAELLKQMGSEPRHVAA